MHRLFCLVVGTPILRSAFNALWGTADFRLVLARGVISLPIRTYSLRCVSSVLWSTAVFKARSYLPHPSSCGQNPALDSAART